MGYMVFRFLNNQEKKILKVKNAAFTKNKNFFKPRPVAVNLNTVKSQIKHSPKRLQGYFKSLSISNKRKKLKFIIKNATSRKKKEKASRKKYRYKSLLF